jgi:hypothetical protein
MAGGAANDYWPLDYQRRDHQSIKIVGPLKRERPIVCEESFFWQTMSSSLDCLHNLLNLLP